MPNANPESIVVLAGGIGAARFLRGLVAAAPDTPITIIGNTGDDREFYGVHVAPDLDIVTYTLAGQVDPERGYGLRGDQFQLLETLEELGNETWFRLGDRDYAFCLHRTLELRRGKGLAQITDDLRRNLRVNPRILPMSEDLCPTFIELDDGRVLHFEEYLIREHSPSNIRRIDLSAAEKARPGPGVLEALEEASLILFCPSNPLVSIGPILAIPVLRKTLQACRAPKVAISPIIGGAPVKGPAAPMLQARQIEVSARGVAKHYREFIDGFVFDQVDAEQAKDIQALGLRIKVVDTLMRTPKIATELAETALALARETQ